MRAVRVYGRTGEECTDGRSWSSQGVPPHSADQPSDVVLSSRFRLVHDGSRGRSPSNGGHHGTLDARNRSQKRLPPHQVTKHVNVVKSTVFEDPFNDPDAMSVKVARGEGMVPKQPAESFCDLPRSASRRLAPHLGRKRYLQVAVEGKRELAKRRGLESCPSVLVARERGGRSPRPASDLGQR